MAARSKEGCCLRNILPRTLQYLSSGTDSMAADRQAELESLLGEAGTEGAAENSLEGNDEQTWHRILLEIVDSKGLSQAEINRKRKLLTFEAFKSSQMMPRTVALEALVAPNVRKMFLLFKRSSTIATLQRLPLSAEQEQSELRSTRLGFLQSSITHHTVIMNHESSSIASLPMFRSKSSWSQSENQTI